MEDYIKIDNYIAENSNGLFEKRKKNPAAGIAVLTAGIAMLIAGIRCHLTDSAQMALISIGFLASLMGLFLLVALSASDCGGYRAKSNGSRMKRYRRYVNGSDRQTLTDCLKGGDIKLLEQMHKETSTSTLLQAYVSADGSLAVVQAEEYIPHDFVPITPPVCLEGADAQALLKWLKA